MDPRKFVDDLLPKLRSKDLTFFPIRHHSPACAAHVTRWIAEHNPASVLIEGPESLTEKVELLVDERCVSPVAFYTNFIDRKKRTLPKDAPAETLKAFGPPRYAAFYPMCDYSPELVAVRHGHAAGARIRFIDLEYAEKVLASTPHEEEQQAVRPESLADDFHLRHSEYIQELTRRTGCRDFNELWDHLFEAGFASRTTDEFIDEIAAWCAMSRLDYGAVDLSRDGTTAREDCMAAAILDEQKRNRKEKRSGPILVVTGGFHTVALPDLVKAKPKRPKPPAFAKDETGVWLIRYSFDRLDALSGYASGMPSPRFYQRMWEASSSQSTGDVAADLIVEVGRLTRDRKFPSPISTPDAIAAVQLTRQLAALRGHAVPTREDVLDGIRSCFVKGEMETDGRLVMNLVLEVLSGNQVGEIPPGAGVPPIVEDFRSLAKSLRLPLESVDQRDMALDLYRKKRHREISRLFHRLELLEVPYAAFASGPDFVHGVGLELMQEHWRVGWSPTAEGSLIEAAVYGPTVEDAATAKLQELIAKLDEQGQARSTVATVEMLLRACRMGLHAHLPQLVRLIDQHIAEDPQLSSVVEGLSQLELLRHSREPLEATQLTAVPQLMQAAYRRACRLVDGIPTCPDEVVNEILRALMSLREVVAAGSEKSDEESALDPDLFYNGLRRVVDHSPSEAQSAVVGAAVGILFSEGKLAEAELIEIACGYLGGAMLSPQKSSGIVRGLLATAREAAWHLAELLKAIDQTFSGWDDEQFLEALPELRLAFADLTPREINRVADRVANLHDVKSLGELVHADLDEAEVQFAVRLNQRVKEALANDGLNENSG
jgi:hypothetical protein